MTEATLGNAFGAANDRNPKLDLLVELESTGTRYIEQINAGDLHRAEMLAKLKEIDYLNTQMHGAAGKLNSADEAIAKEIMDLSAELKAEHKVTNEELASTELNQYSTGKLTARIVIPRRSFA